MTSKVFDRLLWLFRFDWIARLARMIGRTIIFHDLAGRDAYYADLVRRAEITAVGHLSGHVSALDTIFGHDEGLAPLSALEVWALWPLILIMKRERWSAWRQIQIASLGEDLGPFTLDPYLSETDAAWQAKALAMAEHYNKDARCGTTAASSTPSSVDITVFR